MCQGKGERETREERRWSRWRRRKRRDAWTDLSITHQPGVVRPSAAIADQVLGCVFVLMVGKTGLSYLPGNRSPPLPHRSRRRSRLERSRRRLAPNPMRHVALLFCTQGLQTCKRPAQLPARLRRCGSSYDGVVHYCCEMHGVADAGREAQA
jgi:hypothetical protein